LKTKIVAAFLLAVLAVVLATYISRDSFSDILGTVNELTEPNAKAVKLDNLFREIVTLDQEQRAEAIRNPQRPYKYFLDQTGYLQQLIDSLGQMSWDSAQLRRINSLHRVLDTRNETFVSYLKVRAEIANNKEFSTQLDTLASLLRRSRAMDTSVVTTRQTTTTTLPPIDSVARTEKEKNLLRRWFGKKKKAPVPVPKVTQDVQVTVDTVAVGEEVIDPAEIESLMKELDRDQRNQRARLQQKELELNKTNSVLVQQLLRSLEEVQAEELKLTQFRNESARAAVEAGLDRLYFVVIAFVAGAFILVILILIDIGRSNFYRRQLEQKKTEAEELSMIKQRFLANMSHEIRTPLQSILGFAEQLQEEKRSDQEAIQSIRHASEHLLHIVNEVLDYSRINSGAFAFAREEFSILDVVFEVESGIRVQTRRKNLQFDVEVDPGSYEYVKGDSFRLRQILYNLLANAVKFTHQGHVLLRVKLTEQGEQIQCHFEVEDTGIGMSPEEQRHIFNQFEQANSSIAKTYGGTGLGLTIVKALIDAQHGNIEVSSTQGKGTTFRVALNFPKGTVTERVHQERQPVHSFEGEDVLIVDDDPMILRLCDLILSKQDIEHYTTSNPGEVLEGNFARQFTSILLDIRMPGMNGMELCAALRKIVRPETRIVALTAHVFQEEQDILLKSGFDQVLTKPFHEAALLHLLSNRPVPKQVQNNNEPDFSSLKKLTGGEEAYVSILKQFLDETRQDLFALEQCMHANDASELREVVHKLAGRYGQMGMRSVGARFREIEQMLVSGKNVADIRAVLREAVTSAEKNFDLVQAEIEAPENY